MTPALAVLVLLGAVAACRQPLAPTPAPLAIPSSVPSPLGPLPVLVVDSIRGGDPSLFLLGGYDARARVIYLRRDLAPPIKYAVLLHEVCHVRLMDAGLHNLIHPKLADAVCDVWASSRMAEILMGQR